MRKVVWTDEDGYLRAALVRDTDQDTDAPQIGLPCDCEPPIRGQINWSDVERELHNALMNEGLVSWKNINDQKNQQVGVTSIINLVVRRRIMELYKLRG